MSRRGYYLKYKYGISEEQYATLLQAQNRCCAVCGKTAKAHRGPLHVDHNHRTGEIRGLLCNYCNYRIVGRHTDGTVLERAGRYLNTAHTGWFVPEKKKKRKKRGRKNTAARHRNRT